MLKAEDRGPLCKRIVISFTVLAFVSVCLRLYTRFRFHKTGWEDWTIMVSMVGLSTTEPKESADQRLQTASVGTAVCQILRMPRVQ